MRAERLRRREPQAIAWGISAALFCGHRCLDIHQKFKTGMAPRRLSLPVFDYVFRQAA